MPRFEMEVVISGDFVHVQGNQDSFGILSFLKKF
jgi:hypothetical protein